MKKTINFFLNGSAVETEFKAETTVLEMLRNDFELNGIKEGCGEGDCGACTVVIGEVIDGRVCYKSIAGCLYLSGKLEGKHLITIEGLENNGNLHPIQQAILDAHATQCGFCTPGVTLSMLALYLSRENPTAEDFRRYLEGNLCRCTGYVMIKKVPDYVYELKLADRDIRPAWLDDVEAQQLNFSHEDIYIEDEKHSFYSPVSTVNLKKFLKENSARYPSENIRFINGGSDVVVGIKKRHQHYGLLVDLGRMEKLQSVSISPEFITVGGSVSLSRLADSVRDSFPVLSKTILSMCSEQIRSTATMSGNIVNASPVADTVPLLMALGAEIALESADNSRTVPIRGFFHGYKNTEIKPGEWISHIKIPLNNHNFINFEKVTKRKEVDISAVNSAIALNIAGDTIKSASVSFGGVGATTLFLPETSKYLTGKKISEETFEKAGDTAFNEAIPISDVRGSAEYRKAMLKNLVIKHYVTLKNHLSEV